MARRKGLPASIIVEWVCDWKAGRKPTLPDYVRRYPQHADVLINFVLRFAARENRRKNRVKNIRARFKAVSVEQGHECDIVSMKAVYSADPENPNYTYSQATPQGDLDMVITNPAARGAFEQGKEYDIAFSEVEG